MVAEVRSGGIGNRAREQHALKDKGRKSTSMSACPEVGVCVCVCVSHAGVTHQGVCVWKGGGGAQGVTPSQTGAASRSQRGSPQRRPSRRLSPFTKTQRRWRAGASPFL